MKFPWEAPEPEPRALLPWEAPPAPAVRPLEDTVRLLQADMRFALGYTGVMVHATGPHGAELGMLVNMRRGQLVPKGEVRYSGGHVIEFQDIGMPQPNCPTMTLPELAGALQETVTRLGLELE